MKLFKISANQKMLKIGDGDKSMDLAPWIMMTDPIIEQMKSHKDWEGKEVTFASELRQGGNRFITSISLSSTQPVTKSAVTTGAISNGTEVKATTQVDKPYLPKEEWIAEQKRLGKWVEHTDGGKSPEIQNSIKRQSAAHATSRTLIGMQGIVTPDNVIELMDKIYNKYIELIG